MLNVTTSKTTRSITVVADAEDDSGITKYEYSIDNGETWIDGGINNTYTFTELVYDTYEIKVKVTDGVELTNEIHLGISPNLIETPTFKEETIGIVTIIFPEGCDSKYTCSYIKDDGDEIIVDTSTYDVLFDEAGTLIAKVNDGINYTTSSTYSVIINRQTEIAYSGSYEEYVVSKTGYYKIETWGAQGGQALCSNSLCANNAMGGYSSGEIYLEKNDVLYIYSGSAGMNGKYQTTTTGGYNGGGNGSWDNSDDESGGAGGGSTDIRLKSGSWNDSASLRSRIMVAGGGGGSGWTYSGGAGGGLIAEDLSGAELYGKQKSGYAFGYGQAGSGTGYDSVGVGGGGGGYYGGKANTGTSSGTKNSGAGGSSYISGYAGVNSITSETSGTHTNQTKHYSDKYFINAKMYQGVNSGDGGAKITYLGTPSSEDSSKIKNVRYIKDCINGSEKNASNHWIELQAISYGENVAKGKSVTSNFTLSQNYGSGTYDTIVDGIMDDGSHADDGGSNGSNPSCIIIDLGKEYDLEEIAIWHYYWDNRTYENNIVSIAGNQNIYREIYNGEKAENINGNRINFDNLTPTFTESFTGTETNVTIVYPEGCGSTYTCTYQINDEDEVTISESNILLNFTDDASIVANVKSNNTVIATNTHHVEGNNLYVSKNGNDTTGRGTIEKPYATVSKAYRVAKSNAVIYIMDDIAPTETIEFNENKNIIITSYSTENKVNSIQKTSLLSGYLLKISSGSLTLENIIFDGTETPDTIGGINILNGSTVTINDGATIKNFVSTESYGGAFRLHSWQETSYVEASAFLIMNGGLITNNTAPGGAGVHLGGDARFTMNGGEISDNVATGRGGAAIYNASMVVMNGGNIIRNQSADMGGAILNDDGSLILRGGNITDNTAASYGGALYFNSTDEGSEDVYFTIEGGTVTNNTSSKFLTNNIATSDDISKTYDDKIYVIDNLSNFSYTEKVNYNLSSYLNTNYNLTVYNSGTSNGTDAIVYNNGTSNNSKWRPSILRIENNKVHYALEAQHASDLWLWVKDNSSTSGINVFTYQIHANAGGVWYLEKTDDGYYYIKNINGLCLSLPSSSITSGASVIGKTCDSSNAQKWKIKEASTETIVNSISMSSWKSSYGTYQTCTYNSGSTQWHNYTYNFDISISGGSVSSGKLCYASSSSSTTSYCGNYSTNTNTKYGVACFNSSTNWVFYRSSACAYAYATGSHGLSTSRFQC